MAIEPSIRDWARHHPDLAEFGAGVVVALIVLAVSVLQWGSGAEGWTRGLTLGLTLGIVVALAVRRGRRQEEARERAASEQRLQLARDLHDAVASQVSIIGIQAAAGRRVLADQPSRAAEALESIEAAARTANADLRRMLAALRAEVDPKHAAPPGLARLPDLVAEFRAAGLTVDVVGLDPIPALSQGLDAAAYRIIQEALANALAHAGAVRASVALSIEDGMLRIVVENDPGVPALTHRGSGLGLAGMRERAELFGGRLEAGPSARDGFVVEATMPVRTAVTTA